jgi:hypothetical protein
VRETTILIGNSYSIFISQLNSLRVIDSNGGRLLRQNISPKHRKALAGKIGKALNEDIIILSKEMQEILVDDLVTAFFSRLDVLAHVKDDHARRGLTIQCSNETLEMVHGHPKQS